MQKSWNRGYRIKRESFNKIERENLSTGINEKFETQTDLHYLEVIVFQTESFKTFKLWNAKRPVSDCLYIVAFED